ncbi:metal-dependent hydrolase family protein [Maribacter aurantiacus]|uniref:metal-dependent hydrolase family protein n=1 Tax=Maribacter aurantiacus TaxID=1882343 RepID=UPI0019617D31|nr:amidohydrolase family protein [Maribacter aurantiacus]
MNSIRLSFVFIFLCFTIAWAQETTALICGNLITAKDTHVQADAVILIKGDRIVEVGTMDLLKAGYTVIDLSEYTVLPGMIDAHTHPLIYGSEYQTNHLKGSSAFNALRGLKTVQEWLEAGWTTIRIAGDADTKYAHFEIRNAINAGLFKGPRIFGAGHYISVTGGGGDINYISNEQSVIPDGLIVDGKDEMRKAIRQEIKNGSDWIKLLVTGAFMSTGDNPRNVHFSDEELKTAVEEAGQRDVPVMMHAHAKEGIVKAIKFGARSIEHGTFLDAETIDLFLEYDTYLVPTLTVGTYFRLKDPGNVALTKTQRSQKEFREARMKVLGEAHKRGVKLGIGSDNVGFPGNFAANEFHEFVKFGMTPMEAIIAGTKVNAELLKMDDSIGTIEVGKYADIIATKKNPLEDITELQRVQFVMKGGEIIKSTE